jgi:tRNA threonylcarbamoyladenosine biosynthesis protein TsaB
MILALDTATRWLGLALYDGTAVLAEQGWRSHNTQTIELVPAIQQLLGRAELTTADLHALAVTLGPGSYTGLRIGLAVAKGLALAHHLPLFGMNTLDLTAASADRSQVTGQLRAVIEAGRTRITLAPYGWQKQGWAMTAAPHNTTWEELLPSLTTPTTFVGEITAEAAKLMRHAGKQFHILPPAQNIRRAALLAQDAWLRHRKGETAEAALVVPNY